MYYTSWKPATDVFYSGKQWLIRMELAGVSPAEVQLQTQRHVLIVRGRRRDMVMQSGFVCRSMEIRYCTFERSFTFPSPIDADSIRSEYRDGIMRIYLGTL